MLDIGDKIKLIREGAGLSRKAFAAQLGVAEAKIQPVETGRQRADHVFLEKLYKSFQLDANWLLNTDLGMADVAVNSTDFIPIPRYDVQVSAGDGALAQDTAPTGFYGFKRDWMERRGLNPDKLAVVIVTGDSMEPYLRDGDLVLIDHAQDQIVDGRTFVVRFDDNLVVKKVQLIPGGTLLLISANKDYPAITLDLSLVDPAISIIGRVVASMHEWQ